MGGPISPPSPSPPWQLAQRCSKIFRPDSRLCAEAGAARQEARGAEHGDRDESSLHALESTQGRARHAPWDESQERAQGDPCPGPRRISAASLRRGRAEVHADAGRRQGHAEDLPRLRGPGGRARDAAPEADRRRPRAHRRTEDPLDRGRRPRPDRAVQGRRPDPLQPDDLGLRRRHLGTARSRGADRGRDRLHPGGREGRAAHRRVQLLREPADGGLQGGDGPRRRGLHGLRLRAVEGACRPRTAWAPTPAPSSSSAPSAS